MLYKSVKKSDRGFTLIEILIVALAMSLIALVVAPQFNSFKGNQLIKSSLTEVVSSIDQARSHAAAAYRDSEWGVYFDTSEIVLFKGTSYNASNPLCNNTASQSGCRIVIPLEEPAQITDVSLSGGASDSEVYFNRLTGFPSDTGSVTISVGDLSRTITIGSTGIVNTQIPAYKALTVNLNGGTGTITSDIAGIVCGVDCSHSYPETLTVTLTVVADSGYAFTGWSGESCTGTGTCVLTMSDNRTVTASFSVVQTFALDVSKTGTGSGVVTSSPGSINCGTTCSTIINENQNVTMTAIPDVDSAFVSWSGGACAGSTSPCNFVMNSIKTVIAEFEPSSYPQVAATAKNSSSSGTNHSVTLPSGIVAGNLLLVFFSVDGSSDATWPAGWTELRAMSSGTNRFEVGYKIADGTEGASMTITGANEPSAHQALRITNYSGTPEASSMATDNDPSPNAPSLTPSWGAKKTLWIAGVGRASGTNRTTSTSYPTNYTNVSTQQVGTDSNGSTSDIARRELLASSEDPDTFSLSGSDPWIAVTVAIKEGTTSNGPYTLTVSKSGAGAGTVTSSPAGISCGVTCDYSYTSGTSVTLSASASGGSTFAGWSGEGCSGTGTCVVSMTQARSVTATFNPVTYSVGVTLGGTYGSSNVTSSPVGISCGADCSENYNSGTNVTLTANPASNYVFTGWSGDCSGTSTCDLNNLSANKNATATFTPTYALTVTPAGTGSGTVTSSLSGINCGGTCSYSYNSGTSVTLSASASGGSTFAGWSGEGCSGTGTCVVSMTQARSVTATFNTTPPSTYSLTVTKDGTGSGTVTATNPVPPPGVDCGATCNYSYNSGTSVTLSASASGGSTFAGWSGEGCSGTGNCVVSMTQARSVTATFNTIPSSYTLTVSKAGLGSGTVTSSPSGIDCGATCNYDYTSGTSVTLSASASGGSTFAGWSGEGCSGTGTCVVSMSATRSVTATFNPINYTLTITKSGTGSGTVTSSPSGIDCGATCNYDYTSGTSVTLSASASGGSTFAGWSGEGCSGTGTCVVSMTATRSVTATFTSSSAFPVVESTNYSTTSSGTTHTVLLPSGIQAGDLVLIFFAVDSNNSTNISNWNGWTELAQSPASGNSNSNRLGVAYRIMSSSGMSSVNITISASQPSAHQTIRISGFTGTPAISTVASSTTSNPDTSLLTPSWGSKKTLWFSVTSRNSGSTRPTSAYPTNYTNGLTVHVDPSGTDGASLSTARRELEASSENPGAFTITGGTDPWRGYTVGIQGL